MQGFNMGRYVPPDVEGTTSGNKLHKKHALGGRASKLASQGILTVRFEMPFAVWCAHCPKPTIIGQGVRFNAEKKRVGSYHTTPIFSFRMRHAECGGAIEVRTDPRNTTYVVTEGGRKRDTGDDRPAAEGEMEILTEKEREALRSNAFAKLEKTIEDREQLVAAKARIEDIEEAQKRTWEDPYELNRRLRREFRVGRHAREKAGRETEELQDRMSLGIDLVPATEEDRRRAALVDFGPSAEDGPLGGKALTKPLFRDPSSDEPLPTPTGRKKLKSRADVTQMKHQLVSEIVGNTRITQDPFLVQDYSSSLSKGPTRLAGVKRKQLGSESKGTLEQNPEKPPRAQEPIAANSSALVDYGSDSS